MYDYNSTFAKCLSMLESAFFMTFYALPHLLCGYFIVNQIIFLHILGLEIYV